MKKKLWVKIYTLSEAIFEIPADKIDIGSIVSLQKPDMYLFISTEWKEEQNDQ